MAGSNRGWLDRFGPIIALFIFGPLILLSTPQKLNDPVNRVRMENVRLIMDALDRFHSERHAYPMLPLGKPVEDLKKDLVQGGYLKEFPSPTDGFVYISDGAKMYGLLVYLKEEDSLMTQKLGGLCVVGVGIKGTGAWGDPPECRL